MKSLADRVSAALKHAGISQADLARACKISAVSVNNWLSGETRSLKAATAIAAAEALGVNLIWLSFGRGEMVDRHDANTDPNPPQQPAHPTAIPGHLSNIGPGPDIRGAVPLISWVQAGDWCGIVDNFAPGDAEEWLPCPVPHGPRTYVLRVRGESMWNPHVRPSFADGDLIFVDPDKDAIHGSMVIVRLDDKHEATFKRLVIEGDQRYLRAINPAWPEPIIQINGNAATICGVVILKAERV